MAEGTLSLLPAAAGAERHPFRGRGAADGARSLLQGLTTDQRDAVTTSASPLCVIAGAGSGKTRVLTRRIAWQSDQGRADPRRTLAVTFTRRAARELRARLRRLGLNDAVRAGTFHAIALAELRRHAADTSRRPPRILSSPRKLMAELRPRTDETRITDIVSEIGWARARLVTPDRYAEAAAAQRRRSPIGSHGRFARLYEDYEAEKARRRLLDFDDVLADALDLMTSDRRHAAARRWTNQHILVDEFQDINPLQFALLRAWLGPDSTLLVVGDPDQAIYGWNGADPELINSVGEHFRGCAVLHLRTNFRSTPEILASAGLVLGKPPQPAARAPGNEPTITVCDGADEAAALAQAVRRRHRPGAPWRQQAVLARTNDQLVPLRKELERQNIPVAARGGHSLLKRPSVAALLAAWPPDAPLSTFMADARQELHCEPQPPPPETQARNAPRTAPPRTEAAQAAAQAAALTRVDIRTPTSKAPARDATGQARSETSASLRAGAKSRNRANQPRARTRAEPRTKAGAGARTGARAGAGARTGAGAGTGARAGAGAGARDGTGAGAQAGADHPWAKAEAEARADTWAETEMGANRPQAGGGARAWAEAVPGQADDGGSKRTDAGRADVEALLRLAEDHQTLEPGATVGAFRAALASGDHPAPAADGVSLMTFHAAKGLEWPVVHIVGLEDGWVPIIHARSKEAMAEERRLLYVAVTRAEQELHLMWCNRRDMAGQGVERTPSPWLDALAPATDPPAEDQQRTTNLQGLAQARQALPALEPSTTSKQTSTQGLAQARQARQAGHGGVVV